MHVFRVGRIPPKIKDKRLALELITLRNCLCLYKLLKKADSQCLHQLGFKKDEKTSRLLLFCLLRFVWAYLIKWDGRAIGLVGAYKWRPGSYAWLTLAILDAAFRAKGIGSMSIKLLSFELKDRAICTHLYVEVLKDNNLAKKFWLKNGFGIINPGACTDILKKPL